MDGLPGGVQENPPGETPIVVFIFSPTFGTITRGTVALKEH